MKALILSGGQFQRSFFEEYVKSLGKEYFDLILCADKGLKYALESGLEPDFAIGDFDSFPIFKESDEYSFSNFHNKKSDERQLPKLEYKKYSECQLPKLEYKKYSERQLSKLEHIEFIRLNAEKDSTDTHEAIALAISKKADEIHLLAATGDRLDHSLANILLLKHFEDIDLFLVDEKNRIRLLKPKLPLRLAKKEQFGSFVSLIPISPRLEGVDITGCKYNLQNKSIPLGDSIGVSNEITQKNACFQLKQGYALLIEARD